MKAKKQGDFQNSYVSGPVVLNNILVNPTAKELEAWAGWSVDEEPSYLTTNEDGSISASIKVYAKVEDNEKIIVNWRFNITNKHLKSNPSDGSEAKHCFINTKGNTTWATSIETIPEWFKEDSPRLAYIGEETLAQLVAAFNNITFKKDIKNVDTVLLDFPEKLFKGDFSELKQLNDCPSNKIQKIIGIIERNGKYFHMVENTYTFKHWEKTPYLKSTGGKASWKEVINFITKEDPRSRYNPQLITDDLKIWTIEQLKIELPPVIIPTTDNTSTTVLDTTDTVIEAPVVDDLPF